MYCFQVTLLDNWLTACQEKIRRRCMMWLSCLLKRFNFKAGYMKTVQPCFQGQERTLETSLVNRRGKWFRGGTPGNSWLGCAARFSKFWLHFRSKNHFLHPFSDLAAKIHTRFQTWRSQNAAYMLTYRAIMSSLLRLKRRLKGFLFRALSKVGRTRHFGNEKGFFQEVLLKNYLLCA